MYSLDQAKILIKELCKILHSEKDHLTALNIAATNDTLYWREHDLNFVLSYLESYIENNTHLFNQTRKSRGKVLIILSYNEPFIVCVIPVLNALLAGNNVTVRPSSLTATFFSDIWITTGLVKRLEIQLHQVYWKIDEINDNVINFNDVYFFGSYKNARSLASECGKGYTGFHPEVEGADVKILLPEQLENFSIIDDAVSTIRAAFSHAGQSCQRIHGIFVPNQIFVKYIDELQKIFQQKNILAQHVSETYIPNPQVMQELEMHLVDANPVSVIRPLEKKYPLLVVSPDPDSEFVKNAYFLPSLWVIGYSKEEELTEYLNARKFRLGLNIIGEDSSLISRIIAKTRFSRYTINTSHIDLHVNEGWGGISPTGFYGYMKWLEHFSYPAIVITKT